MVPMPLIIIICPLINKVDWDVKQVWYADDVTAAEQSKNLCQWWDNLVIYGPGFGYFANPSKTCRSRKRSGQQNTPLS